MSSYFNSSLIGKGMPYISKSGYCYENCGSKYGLCHDFCGTGQYCCKKGESGCPAKAMEAAIAEGSRCIELNEGTYFSS